MILYVSMLVSLFDEYWLGFKCRMVETTLEEGGGNFFEMSISNNGCVIRSG